MRICHWCNEREMHSEAWGGCEKCPTIPYACTCDAGDNPHDITCERSPHFSGERVWDEARMVAYNLGEAVRKTIGDVDKEYVLEVITKAVEGSIRSPYTLDGFKMFKCEQDKLDPTKFNIIIQWMPDVMGVIKEY